jgi:hypothetical protein
MKLISIFFTISLLLFISSCNDGSWNDERKQKILDQCMEDVYDCECYLETTIDAFPIPEDYNTKDEDKSKEELEAYWTKIDDCLLNQ